MADVGVGSADGTGLMMVLATEVVIVSIVGVSGIEELDDEFAVGKV